MVWRSARNKRLASGDSVVTSGTTQAKNEENKKDILSHIFIFAKHLVANVFFGLDFLRQHHPVKMELGGDRPKNGICAGRKELVFTELEIAPTTTLSRSVCGAKPIAGK